MLDAQPDAVRGGRAGIAVLADMLLTTHFLTMVMLFVWKLPVPVCLLFYVLFAPVEATYWSATLGKVPTGAHRSAVDGCRLHLIGL